MLVLRSAPQSRWPPWPRHRECWPLLGWPRRALQQRLHLLACQLPEEVDPAAVATPALTVQAEVALALQHLAAVEYIHPELCYQSSEGAAGVTAIPLRAGHIGRPIPERIIQIGGVNLLSP